MLRELIRCGGVDATAALSAVASQQAESANLLHLHERVPERRAAELEERRQQVVL